MSAETKQIYSSMIAVMRDVGYIAKEQVNQQQKFRFRGIDDVYNSLHSAMSKHGVFSLPTVLDEHREEKQTRNGDPINYVRLTMKYTFYAEDGSNISAIVIGEAMDSGDKASNKAMAIADKYVLLQAFKIPTAEQKDPDAESYELSSEKISDKQVEELLHLMNVANANADRFLDYFKISELEHLQSTRYPEAKRMLEKKLKNGESTST